MHLGEIVVGYHKAEELGQVSMSRCHDIEVACPASH